jgi:hypothetical protein
MLNISQKRKLKKKIKIKKSSMGAKMPKSNSQPLNYHFLLQNIIIPCVIIFQYQNSTIIKMGMPSPFC